jgi:integrase
MPRPATGAPRWNPKLHVWEARVWMDGKRVPVAMAKAPPCLVVPNAPPARCSCASCETARRAAKLVVDDGPVLEHSGESANEWHARYLDLHAKLGNRIDQHANDWRRQVADTLGTTPMARVSTDQIKAVRDRLTRLRLDGTMSAKRAMNLWSDLIKAPLSRAFSDDDPKYSALRVGPHAANPSLAVKPPASTAERAEDEKERQALDAAEALTLLSCEALTVACRRFYAVALYTGLRPAELYGIVWSDVRLEAQRPVLKVQRSRDGKTLEEKATKTRQSVRDVPIHPHLRPLLAAMRDEADDATARVFPITRAYEIERTVEDMRKHLLVAGIDRDELQHGTAQLVAFDVRSFRTTFATWCTKAGYDSAWVSRWLGHKPKGTAAKHYVKDVPHFEDVNLKPVPPGTVPPFPELPVGLLGSGGQLVGRPKQGTIPRKNLWPLRGSNPDAVPSQRF